MKRITLILLTAIYVLSCTGVAVNRFYCCGKLASVNFGYGVADKQPTKSSSTKDKCCRNEKQNFKVKDKHFSVSTFTLTHPVPVIIPHVVSMTAVATVVMISNSWAYQSNAPPGHGDIPLYNLNCTYRI